MRALLEVTARQKIGEIMIFGDFHAIYEENQPEMPQHSLYFPNKRKAAAPGTPIIFELSGLEGL